MEKRQSKWTAYVGITYFYDAESFHSPQITCVSDNFDDVYNYLAKIRKIQVVDIDEHYVKLADAHGVCASITAASFMSQSSYEAFVNDPSRAPFILEAYGSIDRHIAGISKRESKETYIPVIVADIIEDDCVQFRSNLKVANYTLKELLYYINGLDTAKMMMQSDSRNLIKVCDMIDRIVKDDGYDVIKGIYKRNPILFCEEHEYREMINRKLRMRELDNMYRQKMDDPYS